jgi:hypothetical protein
MIMMVADRGEDHDDAGAGPAGTDDDVEAFARRIDPKEKDDGPRAAGGEEWKTAGRHFQCYAFMDEYRLSLQLVLLGVSIWAMWIFIEVCVPCIFIVTLVSAIF